MGEVALRAFEEGDRPAIVALVRELQLAEGALHDRMKPPEEIGDWYVDYLLESCKRDNGRIVVATLGDEVVGYLAVMTEVSSEGEIDEVSYSYALVQDLAVAERCRGRGIASKLLAEGEAAARAAGARWLRVEVLTENQPAAALYRKTGFNPLISLLEKPLEG